MAKDKTVTSCRHCGEPLDTAARDLINDGLAPRMKCLECNGFLTAQQEKTHLYIFVNANGRIGKAINIVFDCPPSHESGRFIKVEDDQGHELNVGEWLDRQDGTWALRIESLRHRR